MSHVCNVGVVCSKFYTQREPCPEQEWARLEHASKNKSGTLGFCCHTSFCQKFSNFVFCDDFRIDMFLITWEASNSHQQSFQEATRLESLDLGDLGQELCICIDFRMYYVYVVCICIMYVYIYIYILCVCIMYLDLDFQPCRRTSSTEREVNGAESHPDPWRSTLRELFHSRSVLPTRSSSLSSSTRSPVGSESDSWFSRRRHSLRAEGRDACR